MISPSNNFEDDAGTIFPPFFIC